MTLSNSWKMHIIFIKNDIVEFTSIRYKFNNVPILATWLLKAYRLSMDCILLLNNEKLVLTSR